MKIKYFGLRIVELLLLGTLFLGCNPRNRDISHPEWYDRAFMVTSVKDNLNTKDASLFIELFSDLGYVFMKWDQNTMPSEFVEYTKYPIDTLYHTGHGYYGEIDLAGGSVDSYDINVYARNTIFATCLTLSDTAWTYSMKGMSETLMGYTKTSYDGVDNKVVEEYAKHIDEGYSSLASWFLSNSTFLAVRDRWIVYYRDEDEVVEYSARNNGDLSTSTNDSNFEQLSDQVYINSALTNKVVEYANIFPAPPLYSRSERFENHSSQLINYEFNKNIPNLKPIGLTIKEALKLFYKEMGNFGSEFGKPEVFHVLKRETPGDAKTTIAYFISVPRVVNGKRIRGNGVYDHINFMITESGTQVLSMFWADLKEDYENSYIIVKPTEEVLRQASNSILPLIKGNKLYIVSTEQVYGYSGNALVPAYEVVLNDGLRLVIDAVSGKILD